MKIIHTINDVISDGLYGVLVETDGAKWVISICVVIIAFSVGDLF